MTPDEPRPLDPAGERRGGDARLEASLRAALESGARHVSPSDRLAAILADAHAPRAAHGVPSAHRPGEAHGTAGPARPHRARWTLAAAAAAVTLVAGTVWVSGRLETTPSGRVPASVTTTPAASSPAPSTSGTGSVAATLPPVLVPTTPPARSDAPLSGIPVYWIGQAGGRPRLFREFRTVPDEGGPIVSALYAMTREKPSDPDYFTPWGPASRISVEQQGTRLVVDLSRDATATEGVGAQLAESAVQQLVYTATAAASVAGSPVTTVTVIVDGQPSRLWGTSVRVGSPTERAPLAEALAHAWIIAPVEGQQLPAGREIAVLAYGTSFEGTFTWEVRPAGGRTPTQRGVAQGGSTGQLTEFDFTIAALPPGSYVLSLSTDDPSGGAEGGGAQVDTKAFTVR